MTSQTLRDTRRHRYSSHSLRFAVKRSLESLQQFRQRINKAAEAEEEGQVGAAAGGDNWVLGTIRDKGSIHSDIWRGSAELAERDAIGVFPISGWWKEKPALQRWDRSARYALVVSVRVPGANIDIYTPIAKAMGNKLRTEQVQHEMNQMRMPAMQTMQPSMGARSR